MSILLIRMKNATDAPRSWTGMRIQPGDYYTIQPEEIEDWREDSDVNQSIVVGDLVVNDGVHDLIPDDGLLRLHAVTEAQRILFQSGGFSAKSSYEGILEASTMCTGLVGFCFPASFYYSGELLLNSYMNHSGVSMFQVPFDCKIRGVSCACSSEVMDVDINIQYETKLGRNRVLSPLRIRSSSSASFAKLDDGEVLAGTIVKVFAERAGRNPLDLSVDLFFQTISNKQSNIVR